MRTRPSARLALLDESCSRFCPDAELTRANGRSGEAIEVSPLLAELLSVALRAADETGGLVVPRLGSQLRAAGYGRAYSVFRARDRWTVGAAAPSDSWRAIELDVESRTLRIPHGVELDLGATSKGWAADDAARAVADASAAGVLVSLGGDVSVAGQTPHGGWPVLIAESHDTPLHGRGPVVAIAHGGLATSSTGVCTWRTDRGLAHHLLDPERDGHQDAVTHGHACRVAAAPIWAASPPTARSSGSPVATTVRCTQSRLGTGSCSRISPSARRRTGSAFGRGGTLLTRTHGPPPLTVSAPTAVPGFSPPRRRRSVVPPRIATGGGQCATVIFRSRVVGDTGRSKEC